MVLRKKLWHIKLTQHEIDAKINAIVPLMITQMKFRMIILSGLY